MKTPAKKALITIGSILFWLLVWQVVSMAVGLDLLFPSPLATFEALTKMALTGKFWLSVGSSLLRILLGFSFGLLCGAVLAFVSHRFSAVGSLFAPLIACLKTAPVASFIIIAYLWLRIDAIPVLIAFLMVLPLSYRSLKEALAARDEKLLEMAKHYALSPFQIFCHIDLPALRAALISVCSVGMGFAWKAGVAAEVIAHIPSSVGEALYTSKVELETPQLFAWTVVIIAVSLVLESLLLKLLQKKEVA